MNAYNMNPTPRNYDAFGDDLPEIRGARKAMKSTRMKAGAKGSPKFRVNDEWAPRVKTARRPRQEVDTRSVEEFNLYSE